MIGRTVSHYIIRGEKTSIWLLPVNASAQADGAPVRLTTGTQEETMPAWSPSGLIAFAGLNSAYVNLWMAPLDADRAQVTGELQRITRTGGFNGNPSVSPDGRSVAFRSNRTGNTELWFKDLRTGREIQLTNTPGNEDRPALSPDGTRVVYSFPEGKNQWKAGLRNCCAKTVARREAGFPTIGASYSILPREPPIAPWAATI
jgi:dipeptidyl aminopeptidase/acylaminoacyl peptidase